MSKKWEMNGMSKNERWRKTTNPMTKITKSPKLLYMSGSHRKSRTGCLNQHPFCINFARMFFSRPMCSYIQISSFTWHVCISKPVVMWGYCKNIILHLNTKVQLKDHYWYFWPNYKNWIPFNILNSCLILVVLLKRDFIREGTKDNQHNQEQKKIKYCSS